MLVMPALDNQAPWPMRRMREIAWEIVVYCIEKSWLGIKLLMVRMVEPGGEERPMNSIFFSEYFLVATKIGLILIVGKDELENVPILNVSLTSLSRS